MPPNTEEDILNKVMAHYTIDISAVEEENRMLRETVTSLKEELTKFNRAPLLIAEVKELVGENVILRLNNGNEFFVDVSSACSGARPGDTVLVEQRNLTVVKKLAKQKRFNVEKFVIIERPTVVWDDIGGLAEQANEIREVMELPLLKPELFKKIGTAPPKGILLPGEPGTGKTMLAKAVAASTNSTFIEIVGSELVQKFIGEGSKLVKEIFTLAREKAPSIIFIDEIDAIASQRVDIGTSGEREVQRTFMQLLAEIDGFKPLGNVKIIGCTNRRDILDPAVMRPGRLDRLIEVPPPSIEGIKEIFKIHTAPMKLAKINLDELCVLMNGFSGADIKSVCTEAGYFAIRADRVTVSQHDFVSAIGKIRKAKNEEPADLKMFG